MSQVFVLDPGVGKYLPLPAKKKRYTKGLTLAMHKLVLRNRGAQSLMADPDAENRLLELRRMAETELKNISAQMEAKEKRARAAIMQQPVIRDMMGGDIHLIEVAPSPTGMEVRHDTGFDRADAFEKPVRSKRGTTHNDAHAQLDNSDTADVHLQGPVELQASKHLESAAHLGGHAPANDATKVMTSTIGDASAASRSQAAYSGAASDRKTEPGRCDDDDDDIVGTFDDY